MNRLKILVITLVFFSFSGFSQIKVSSDMQAYDSINNGNLIYYQFSWDDPIDELPEIFPLKNTFKAFETIWDTMVVSDGLIVFGSSKKLNSYLIVDATSWDLIDKGYTDTVNYPNISPIIVSSDTTAIEWRGFGFTNELDSLDSLPSTGNVIMKINSNNRINITYGDFIIERPDLCFEGFGGLRPSVNYIDENDSIFSWFVFGDPKAPSIDTTSDTAFASLPEIGRTITIDFNKTNFIKSKKSVKISVYPNPAFESIKIEGLKKSDFEYNIIALNGKSVKKGNTLENSINIGDLKSGNYLIKIKENNNIYYSKFIKL
ncbi:MAG: T9SS type A sorting domain-containing protein [Bacteroidia bacterium]|nr:T9SS type A sorting domain-containing protein [Bacteroidia bacterium]